MLRDYMPFLKRSLVLHLILLVLLTVAITQQSLKLSMPKADPKVNIVKATAVDESQVQAEVNRLKAIEAQRKQQREDEQRSLKKTQQQRQQEEQRIAALKQKQAAQQKKYQENLKRIKAEEEAMAKKRAAEKQRLAELEKQRQEAQAAADKRQREEELKKQIEAEEKRQAEERQAQNAAMIKKYKVLIIGKISRNWIQPPSYTPGMVVVLNVKVLPTGEVVSVTVVKSSGDPAYDRSAENAARKASPLPLPDDPEVVSQMRDIVIAFDPSKKI